AHADARLRQRLEPRLWTNLGPQSRGPHASPELAPGFVHTRAPLTALVGPRVRAVIRGRDLCRGLLAGGAAGGARRQRQASARRRLRAARVALVSSVAQAS